MSWLPEQVELDRPSRPGRRWRSSSPPVPRRPPSIDRTLVLHGRSEGRASRCGRRRSRRWPPERVVHERVERSPASHSGFGLQTSPTRYASGSTARTRAWNSRQKPSSTSSGTSRRQPSMPKRTSARPRRGCRPHVRLVEVQLGQRRQVPPGLVAQDVPRCRPAREPGGQHPVAGRQLLLGRVGAQAAAPLQDVGVEVEPLAEGRVVTVLRDVVEGPEAAPAVVEDAVEDDPHPSGMGLIQQLAQGGIAAQEGVHVEVVVGVIAMVGGGGEDRVQVQGRDAQSRRRSRCATTPRRSPPLKPCAVGGTSQGSSGPGFATRRLAARRSGNTW